MTTHDSRIGTRECSETRSVNEHENAKTTASMDSFADNLLHIAHEVERAEMCIKRALQDAACRGDIDTIQALLHRWLRVPLETIVVDNDNESNEQAPA